LGRGRKQQKKLEVVRQHAARLVGAEALEKALSGEAVQEQLQQNVRSLQVEFRDRQKRGHAPGLYKG